MAINDRDADGRDVSWLWDVPLGKFSDWGPKVVASGTRATDMSLRLHYAGIEATCSRVIRTGNRKADSADS